MTLYFYTAKDAAGKLVRGTVDAVSEPAARDALSQMNLDATELHQATQAEKQARDDGKFDPPNAAAKAAPAKAYYPLSVTIRLYAGWLMAWYLLVYALGSYQYTRPLPFKLPFVEALLPPFSPIVLTFTLAAFLYLLGGSVHQALGGGRPWGWLVTIVIVGVFAAYQLNL